MTDPEFILLCGRDIRHREEQYLAEQCNKRILGRLEPIKHCSLLHCASLCLCRAALTVQAGSSEAEERGQRKITGNTGWVGRSLDVVFKVPSPHHSSGREPLRGRERCFRLPR